MHPILKMKIAMAYCPACGVNAPVEGIHCPECGTPLPGAGGPHGAPARISFRVLREILLGYTDDRSDKQYNLTIVESAFSDGSKTYTVLGRYGRRGTLRQKHLKYDGNDYFMAEGVFSCLALEKTKKGYVVEGQNGNGL